MTHAGLDDDLDAMLATARPANPALDSDVAAQLEALVARALPRGRRLRRRWLMTGAAAGALLFAGFGAGTAVASGGAELPQPETITVVVADDAATDGGCTFALEDPTTVVIEVSVDSDELIASPVTISFAPGVPDETRAQFGVWRVVSCG